MCFTNQAVCMYCVRVNQTRFFMKKKNQQPSESTYITSVAVYLHLTFEWSCIFGVSELRYLESANYILSHTY